MNLDFLLYHLGLLAIMLLLTQSLNLIWRSNMFSLGHHGFWGIGAYTAAVVVKLILPSLEWPLNTMGQRFQGFLILLASVIAAALVSGAIGFALFSLVRRLKEDYFLVATLVFASVVVAILTNWSWLGGGLGIDIPYLVFTNAPAEHSAFTASFAIVLLALNMLLYLLIQRTLRSPLGLYIEAVRDDEVATLLTGVNVVRVQRLIFASMATVAGIAGGFFLHFSTVVVPSDFNFIAGIPIILYVVLGGLDSRRCIVGTVVLYTVYEIIKLRFFGIFPAEIGQTLADLKEIFLALTLILGITLPVVWQRRKAVVAKS